MKKAILLDWDGVLCDSLTLYYDLYQVTCERFGRTLPIDSAEQFRTWYNPHWERNYWDMGFTPAEFADVQKFAAEYLRYENATLFPGVVDNLKIWAAEFPLAIVSTTLASMIRNRLHVEGLEDLFTHYTGGEDGLSEKRAKVGQTLNALGVETGVMVGDTPLDIDAGRHNGLVTVGVTYGWVTPERVLAEHPDVVVDAPDQLREAVLTAAREA
jgi:phosphoglycolate phosphatase